MKKSMLLAAFVMFLFIISACSKMPGSQNTSNTKQTNTTTSSGPSQGNSTNQSSPTGQPSPTSQQSPTNQPGPTSKPSTTIQPSPTSQPGPTSQPSPTSKPITTSAPSQAGISISNSLLTKNMEAVKSYRRKLKTVTTIDGQQSEKYEESAYIKNPLSVHLLLDFITSDAYSEEIIVNGTSWNRMNKDDKWDKFLPGQWTSEAPVKFKYTLNTQQYPINYEKLKLQQVGQEKLNGLNCIKYTVSGSYEDKFTATPSPQKPPLIFPYTLSATGNIWIADDPVIKQVIIRQRIKVNMDVVQAESKDKQGNPLHKIGEGVIEDDVLDINSTVIKPPSDSETITH